ncbi:MAG TPA: carboxylating nicotinate-nucleotide diphosphorylase, partial [Firmicutes bacterium]|nr:carboxylating nicotinate-nucleotide diphosphorylase [Bacillota bacterium]
IGAGDVTTDVIVPEKASMKAVFVAKAEGIVCGLPIAKKVFQKLDKNIKMSVKKKDGAFVRSGEILASVKGRARAILTGERLALNIMQRLSGISTLTSKFAAIAKPYKVTILDTRKTTPLFRIPEKYAVRIGGGENHRMGLYDAVLIKDNHWIVADIEKAYVDLRRWIPKNMKTEIEVHDEDMLEKAIKLQPDIIMLDNMPPNRLEKCITQIRESNIPSKIEVSGGLGLHNIRDVLKKKDLITYQ